MSITLQSILKNKYLNISQNPKGTDKGDRKSYITHYYESAFLQFRNQKIKLLEIGFRHGASLALWSEYFSNGNIYGVDNKSDAAVNSSLEVESEWVNRKNVCVFYGDAYDMKFSKSFGDDFTIIIDDGPHTLFSQMKSLKLYSRKLLLGGLFVVEDIQKIGGLSLLPLMFSTPLTFSIKFHDFRKFNLGGDDILYVAKRTDCLQLMNRVSTFLKFLFYCFSSRILL